MHGSAFDEDSAQSQPLLAGDLDRNEASKNSEVRPSHKLAEYLPPPEGSLNFVHRCLRGLYEHALSEDEPPLIWVGVYSRLFCDGRLRIRTKKMVVSRCGTERSSSGSREREREREDFTLCWSTSSLYLERRLGQHSSVARGLCCYSTFPTMFLRVTLLWHVLAPWPTLANPPGNRAESHLSCC